MAVREVRLEESEVVEHQSVEKLTEEGRGESEDEVREVRRNLQSVV